MHNVQRGYPVENKPVPMPSSAPTSNNHPFCHHQVPIPANASVGDPPLYAPPLNGRVVTGSCETPVILESARSRIMYQPPRGQTVESRAIDSTV